MHVKRIFLSLFFCILIIFSIFFLFINSKIKVNSLNKLNLDNINLYNENNFFIQNDNWTLSIPKLNLKNIPIKDNISSDVLENFIGHFPTSSYLEGNVCLAAHNAGFSSNYFQDIYLLEEGDEIEYDYFGNIKIYKVNKKYVIDENNLDVLNVDEVDKLTLITCISGSPQKRLCVEAVFKE
jgi:LPXTG-site transpeptidase (sortase) family protein